MTSRNAPPSDATVALDLRWRPVGYALTAAVFVAALVASFVTGGFVVLTVLAGGYLIWHDTRLVVADDRVYLRNVFRWRRAVDLTHLTTVRYRRVGVARLVALEPEIMLYDTMARRLSVVLPQWRDPCAFGRVLLAAAARQRLDDRNLAALARIERDCG